MGSRKIDTRTKTAKREQEFIRRSSHAKCWIKKKITKYKKFIISFCLIILIIKSGVYTLNNYVVFGKTRIKEIEVETIFYPNEYFKKINIGRIVKTKKLNISKTSVEDAIKEVGTWKYNMFVDSADKAYKIKEGNCLAKARFVYFTSNEKVDVVLKNNHALIKHKGKYIEL